MTNTKGGADMTLTTAMIAAELNTTPKTLRKFLRSENSGIESVGKGARYAFEKKQIRGLKSRFEKWESAQNANLETDSE